MAALAAGISCNWNMLVVLLLLGAGVGTGAQGMASRRAEGVTDLGAPQATLLVLSSDLAGFPLGTAKSALKLRAIFSEPVTTLDLGMLFAGNGALDSFSLKTFDNTTSSLTLLQNGAPVSRLNSTKGDPVSDASAWGGLLGPVALDFYVRPAHPLSTVNVTFRAGAFADVSGNANEQPASVAFLYDPTNPSPVGSYPSVTSIDQTSVTLTFSFTKTCTVNYTLYNHPVGYSPGNWTALRDPELELDPLKAGQTFNGSLSVLAGKVVDVTVGGLRPNQGYLLLVSAVDQYGNEAQAVPGAAFQTRNVPTGAVGNPSLTPGPVTIESAQIVLSTSSANDNSSLRYVVTPLNPNTLVPTRSAVPTCDSADRTSHDASINSTLHFDYSVIVSAIACGKNNSSDVVAQPVIAQAAAPIVTLPAGPFLDNVTVSLLYNGSLPNSTVKYTFTPAGSPLIPPACPYTGWAGYGRKAGPKAQIALTTSGTLQAITCSNAGLASDVVSTGPLYIKASLPGVLPTDPSPQAPYTVSLTPPSPDSTVRYLYSPLSGSQLTTPLTCNTPGASATDVGGGDVILWESGMLAALACKAGVVPSDVTLRRFILRASAPKITPTKGVAPFNVTIVTRTSGALLLYTSDPKVPLRCPAVATLSGGSPGQPTSAPSSENTTLALQSASQPAVLFGRTRITVQANATLTWRATACPFGEASLSPSDEVNATVVVAQTDPSFLAPGQAQLTAEVTILDANTSNFNDTKAQLRFETAVASAVSGFGNVSVSVDYVIVTSIILAGAPSPSVGRSTLETGPLSFQTGAHRRLLASPTTNATSAPRNDTSAPRNGTSAPRNVTSAVNSTSSPSLTARVQSLLLINVSSQSTSPAPNTDQSTNSTSLVVQFTIVTTPVLGPQVRSALTSAVEDGTLASALTGAGFRLGGAPSPTNAPPQRNATVGSSSNVPSGVSAGPRVTNSSVVPVSVTSADGVALTATGVQYAEADLQSCVFTSQTGICSFSPTNNRQCARIVNYTLVTAPGPAGQACPVGLSPFLTRVQAFEGCALDQCRSADHGSGSSLPVGIWVVIAVLVTAFLVASVVGVLLYRRWARRTRERAGAKGVEDTWQAPLREPPPPPLANHFQSGGDVGMRASPMWDSAVLERLGHSDVGGARERQGALEEGGIVDFETYCEAWDRRFIKTASSSQGGPIHTTSEAGDDTPAGNIHTTGETGFATSPGPVHTQADFEDKPVDNGSLPRESIHIAPKAAEPPPSDEKQQGRTLTISYEDGSHIVNTPNSDLLFNASGPLSRIAPSPSLMHDRSKSGPLNRSSSGAEVSSGDSSPLINNRYPQSQTLNPTIESVKKGSAGSRLQSFDDDGMEEVVLELMRIDQDSIAQNPAKGFAPPAGGGKPEGLRGVWRDEKISERVTSVEGGGSLTAFENRPLTQPQQELVNGHNHGVVHRTGSAESGDSTPETQSRASPKQATRSQLTERKPERAHVSHATRDVSPSMFHRSPSPALVVTGNLSRNVSPGSRSSGLPPKAAQNPGVVRSTSPGFTGDQNPGLTGTQKPALRRSRSPALAETNPGLKNAVLPRSTSPGLPKSQSSAGATENSRLTGTNNPGSARSSSPGTREPGLVRSTSPGLPRSQSPADGTAKVIQRSTPHAYAGPFTPETAGLPRRAKTPDVLQRPRDAVTRYSQGFLNHRASPSAPLKARPDSDKPAGTDGTERTPEKAGRGRSKSSERPRERRPSDEKMDVELRNIIVQLKAGLECPEPLVVNFGENGSAANQKESVAQPPERDIEQGDCHVAAEKRSESLKQRLGAWMKGEPKSAPVSEIHVMSEKGHNHTSFEDETASENDRSSIMGDGERSDAQGSKIWAWLRTSAHPDARSVVSEPDAAEMRAAEMGDSAELGGLGGAEGGEASFWKKRIFGRSFSTMSFNSPPKDEALEEQKQLRPSWAAVSY